MKLELIAAMNAWRLAQEPPLEAREAIEELLRRALVDERFLAAPPSAPVGDRNEQARKDFIRELQKIHTGRR